jgi:hypothetical protein
LTVAVASNRGWHRLKMSAGVAFCVVLVAIISLGLVDAVARLPLAIAAIVTSGAVFRAPLIVVLLFCLGCIGVLARGPRLVRLPFVSRSERVGRIFTRVGDSAGFSRPMFVASGFLFGCCPPSTSRSPRGCS